MRLQVEHLRRARPGESHCGDAPFVRHEDGKTLFAIIDALGHGEAAAEVADAACAHLATAPLNVDVAEILNGLHHALLHGRGAAVTLCLFDSESLASVAVGNVELRSRSSKVGVGISGGIVGQRMRTLKPYVSPLRPGERVVLFSDGLSSRLSLEETAALSTKDACQLLFDRYARSTDDAAVLVADAQEIAP